VQLDENGLTGNHRDETAGATRFDSLSVSIPF
jgi:hypothetical protein